MNTSNILTDVELANEIKDRIDKGAFSPLFPLRDKKLAIANIDRVIAGEIQDPGFETEAIIRELGRPALFIKNGTFQTPESDIWKLRLEQSRTRLENVISAVGRIEVKNHPDYEWIGTGWVVAKNMVVTNRHVANEFAIRNSGGGYRFRRNFEGRQMSGRIDLREEYMQPDELEFVVQNILHIEEQEGPDLAILEVEFSGSGAQPNPIELAESINSSNDVAVIGYPAWDGRRNDPVIMHEIFKGVYDVKRLQPGKLMSVNKEYLTHDCSTLGGNSGSPVIDLTTGEAVGLHFAGSYKRNNYAVTATILRERLEQLQDSTQ